MKFLHPSYDPWVVACSLLVASFATYVALDLAKRVRDAERPTATLWWIGASFALGSGIWCMHVVGMLAFQLPLELGYRGALTFASWAAAVGGSAITLHITTREKLRWPHVWGSALSMGAAIVAMHYTGMAALDMAPPIDWDWQLVIASIVIAICASAVALEIFFKQRKLDTPNGLRYQIGAAFLMGLAICCTHYTGMAAARFPADASCLSVNAMSERSLGTLVVFASVALLALTLFTSHLDARVQARTSGINDKLRNANDQLRRRALRDPLTNLPNRVLFEKRLAQALKRLDTAVRQGEDGGRIAVLFIDLDGFKPVNDTLGHAVGDVVLKEVASRLRSSVRAGDTVARIGGDEFIMLMECESTQIDPVIAARRIVESVSASIPGSGRPIQVSCSVGIAIYPEHGPRDRLVAHADAAMYEAKRAGGNTWAHFEERLEGAAPEMLGLQNDLRSAIELDQLELHYQPKIDGRSGETHGVEALLRWHHPTHGTVSPVVFIPLAERFGLIGRIGNWVIDEACAQIERWSVAGVRMNVAINLSVHQLREPDLVERVEQALLRHHVDASQLLCEITESVAMGDVKATQAAFSGLAQIGVMLSIDDFGTGYSSLSYLRRLPARQLKIDRSFVMDLETSSDARAIVSAVVHLAHDLGLAVVAEGVETSGQRDVLVGLDCDELQGYLFAKPMRANELLGWMASRTIEATAGAQRASELARAQAQASTRIVGATGQH